MFLVGCHTNLNHHLSKIVKSSQHDVIFRLKKCFLNFRQFPVGPLCAFLLFQFRHYSGHDHLLHKALIVCFRYVGVDAFGIVRSGEGKAYLSDISHRQSREEYCAQVRSQLLHATNQPAPQQKKFITQSCTAHMQCIISS